MQTSCKDSCPQFIASLTLAYINMKLSFYDNNSSFVFSKIHDAFMCKNEIP